AYLYPARIAPPTPRLRGRSRTSAFAARATSDVRSVEPSLTTRMSAQGTVARVSSMTCGRVTSSFHEGMITRRRGEGAGMGTILSTEGGADCCPRPGRAQVPDAARTAVALASG